MIRILLFVCICFNSSAIAQFLPLDINDSNKKTFDISLHIEKTDNQYQIVANFELAHGSYIISPYSEDTTYLHFEFSVMNTDKLILTQPIQEIPSSIEEFDPILERPVRFIRTNTIFRQAIEVREQIDFELAGLIEFLVEPSCIPYDVEFRITNRSGVLKIDKVNTFISKEYKQRE